MNVSPDEIFVFFGFIFLVILSPGPSNLMCAASGARFGISQSIPFIVGMNIMVLIPALLTGFGVGELLSRFPTVLLVIKYLGAAVVLYMAYKFFRSGTIEKQDLPENVPTLWDGILVQFLNAKGLAALVLIYSQVVVRNVWSIGTVLVISLFMTITSVGCHFLWLYGSVWLTRNVTSNTAVRIQGIVFGIMLTGIAIWIVLT
jgi:threonine/homoserine/homoserine lactone efflux protein